MAYAERERRPEALVIGGDTSMLPKLASFLAKAGLGLKEHWVSQHGRHDYTTLYRLNVKVIVLIRENLDGEHYQRACTAADRFKIPFVKWDSDWSRFKERLQLQHCFFEAPVPPPPAAAVQTTPASEAIMPITPPPVITLDTLLSICELIRDELYTHPLYSGVTIRVAADRSMVVTPEARTISIPSPDIKVIAAETPPTPRPPPPPPPTTVVPFVRPVEQPCPPRMETVSNGVRRFKPIQKGQKLDMRCRVPGCKNGSGGPRNRYMCKSHQRLPLYKQREYLELWAKTPPEQRQPPMATNGVNRHDTSAT